MVRKLLAITLISAGLCAFADEFAYTGALEGETGVKLSSLWITISKLEDGRSTVRIPDFLSMYGYIGSRISPTLSVGASLEMGAGASMGAGYGLFYNPFDINAVVNLKPSRNLRLFAGAGLSFNNIKENSPSSKKERIVPGVHFSLGGKINISPSFGILLEYKGRMLFGEDTVAHGVGVGVYMLAR